MDTAAAAAAGPDPDPDAVLDAAGIDLVRGGRTLLDGITLKVRAGKH
jgi:ABC-type molybdenum transport system ATPase subunit/photorepair protein PhrA